MFEHDFERTRDYLRTKLEDYLRVKGINPHNNFRCLNPAHQDHHPSMSYNPTSYTVECHACKAKYDIFDLVGIDYNLLNFTDKLNKLKELYIPNKASHQKASSYDNHHSMGVTFGVSNLNTNNTEPNNFNNNFYPNHDNMDMGEQMRPSGTVFGANRTNFNNDDGNFQNNISSFASGEMEIRANFQNYLTKIKGRRNETSFFAEHGISDEIVEKFNLGYDDNFQAGIERNTGEHMTWQAVIIPYEDQAFVAYNIRKDAKDNIRRQGITQIFNYQALNLSSTIFITQSELDVLSLLCLGSQAISIISRAHIRILMEKILSANQSNLTIYVDNIDNELTEAVCAALSQCHISYKRINLAYPYQSINEALVKDQDNLSQKINDLDTLLNFKLQDVVASRPTQFIRTSENLLNLGFSPNLYALAGNSQELRLFLLRSMQDNSSGAVYVASLNKWQMLCNYLNLNEDELNAVYFNLQLLAVEDSTAMIDAMQNAAVALHLQDYGEFCFIVDLQGFATQDIATIARKLAQFTHDYKQAVLVLCSNLELLQGESLQTIKLENGLCTSIDNDGQKISFKL